LSSSLTGICLVELWLRDHVGHSLNYASSLYHGAIREALAGLLEVEFDFEDQGTSVIYFRPQSPTSVTRTSEWVPKREKSVWE